MIHKLSNMHRAIAFNHRSGLLADMGMHAWAGITVPEGMQGPRLFLFPGRFACEGLVPHMTDLSRAICCGILP